MTLGTFGSTLSDELNRLANGGTYRTMASMVDEALAAKQWANRENINPYSTDTVGILNEIAGLGLDKKNWLDFNGVCNYIAGTTGLPAAAALRQVYPTTDLLTGVASYYIDATDASASTQTITNLGSAGSLLPTTLGSSTAADSNDPKFLDFTGTNYVYLPGVNSNFLSVPDNANLRITGDLDLRFQVAMDDWTPSAIQYFGGKYAAADRGWALQLDIAGNITLTWSPDGTTTNLTATSTVTTGITDGTTKWIRATLDVDNGASGRDIKFFTSDNGTSWTQLGTTITQAGTTSIFASTQAVTIGTYSSGALATNVISGKVFRAQIFNGIDGTKVLDVDTSVITTGAATSFTAVTGQTVTINRSTSGRKTVAVTQPTWLFGTDDYMEVNNRYMSSGTYLYLPGVANNNATTPDSAAISITGDMDLRAKIAMDDWTPSARSTLLTKWGSGGNAFYFYVEATSGNLRYAWTTAGGVSTDVMSTASVGVTDGSTKWVRVTHDVDNGSSQNVVTFFTSDDGTNWTQLGNPLTQSGVTNIADTTSGLVIGGNSLSSEPFRGKFFRAQVLNGINGTVVFDANFETSITSLNQASFTESSANAATVTINRNGSTYRSAGVIDAGYLYPGATNTFSASATSFLDFGASDSFTLLYIGRQWATPTNYGMFLEKWLTSSSPRYSMYQNATNFRQEVAITDTANVTSNPGYAVWPSWSAGALFSAGMIVNRSTQTMTVSTNSSFSGTANITTVGSLVNFGTLNINRRSSNTIYSDIETYAVAIFRQALTAAQIRQISNYFANREVYL